MSEIRCFYCPLPARWMCDAELFEDEDDPHEASGQCNRPMCNGHRRVRGKEDYCLAEHAPAPEWNPPV